MLRPPLFASFVMSLLVFGMSFGPVHADDAFDATTVGSLPAGWSAAKTGTGDGSVWKIQEDAKGPSGKKVLTQTSSAGHNGLFNLCVAAEPVLTDVNLRVALKPLTGKIDQGGGPVWRYQDEKNYYVARWNPLEGDFRLFRVFEGKRTQLGETVRLAAKVGEWHTITVRHRGEHINCLFDDKQHFDLRDGSITKPGRTGFWSKADAVTSFAAPTITGVSADVIPTQVLVVNTGDASVSRVDLTSMKQVSRHPVGAKPYGIAVLLDGKNVAVGVEEEQCIKFFSLPDFEFQAKVPIGKMHNDHVILSQDGREIYVANFYSDDVFVIDVEARKEATRISGCSAPHVVKYGPLHQRAFVTCKKITGIAIIDPANKTLLKFHQLNVNPRSLTFSPDESKVYFGSFWVNGFFEMETESGKVTRLFSLDPPADNKGNQEVTYHGVEAIGNNIVLAANEGRSYVDAVDVSTGKLLDRLTTVNKPCCVERIPGPTDQPARVLVSNIGDGTLQLVEVGMNGKLKALGRAVVGAGPKRVAFLPALSR